MNKENITNINNYIKKGIAKKEKDNPIGASFAFFEAWEELSTHAPRVHQDYQQVIEAYNQGEDDYDWYAWIWEIGEVLEQAGAIHKDCLKDRLQFIQAFKKRFPATTDADILECLQRHLIKTYFLLKDDAAGEKAVQQFYQQFPDSVSGYMDWADTLLQRAIPPTVLDHRAALAIYEKGVKIEDDADFIDILKERIEETKEALMKYEV